MSIKKIPSPPTLSRHFLIPTHSNSSFCLLLNESLKNEKTTGLVMFSKGWYGLIHSQMEKEKTSMYFDNFSSFLVIK